MGLEPSSTGRWGPPQPISLPGSNREYQNVDYHKNNLRNLRRQSKKNGEGTMDGMDDNRRSRPMRALPPDPRTMMEANKKRYEHVQSKVSAWASTTSIPDSLASTPKSPKKVIFRIVTDMSILRIKISGSNNIKHYRIFLGKSKFPEESCQNRSFSSPFETYCT